MAKVPTARILVIDDNAAMLDILVTCLGEEGYEVSGALTGDEGLECFASSGPDLVLLDLTLSGGLNGVEVLKRTRSIDPAARVVIVTGNPNSPLAREALELDALARVDKPFDLAHRSPERQDRDEERHRRREEQHDHEPSQVHSQQLRRWLVKEPGTRREAAGPSTAQFTRRFVAVRSKF